MLAQKNLHLTLVQAFFFNDYAATEATGVAGKLSLVSENLSFEILDLNFEILDLSFEILSKSFDILDSVSLFQTVKLGSISLLKVKIPARCENLCFTFLVKCSFCPLCCRKS